MRYGLTSNIIELLACCSYIDRRGRMVLLHGFIKKMRKTPDEDLQLARSRKRQHERGLQ